MRFSYLFFIIFICLLWIRGFVNCFEKEKLNVVIINGSDSASIIHVPVRSGQIHTLFYM